MARDTSEFLQAFRRRWLKASPRSKASFAISIDLGVSLDTWILLSSYNGASHEERDRIREFIADRIEHHDAMLGISEELERKYSRPSRRK